MKLSIEDVHDNGAYRVEVRGDFEKIVTALSILVHSVAERMEMEPSLLLMMLNVELSCRKSALDNSIRIDVENERDTD